MSLRKGATFHLFNIISLLSLLMSTASGNDGVEQWLPFKHTQPQFLKTGEVHSDATMNDLEGEKQELYLTVKGIHKKRCRQVIPRMSRYERLKEWIPFMKKSDYNSETSFLLIATDHALLPWPMTMQMTLPRISDSPKTEFVFITGFLKGLKGEIHWEQKKLGCFISLESYWKGPNTKISATIFELFTQTLARIAIEKLFRVALPG